MKEIEIFKKKLSVAAASNRADFPLSVTQAKKLLTEIDILIDDIKKKETELVELKKQIKHQNQTQVLDMDGGKFKDK